MLAISISFVSKGCPAVHPRWAGAKPGSRRWLLAALASLLTLLFLAPPAFAQSPASEQAARTAFDAAQTRYGQAQTNVAAAWQFARAAFDLADLLHQFPTECDQIAQKGVDACRQAIAEDPNSAPAHYYLALNLGEVVRDKKLGALHLLREMEQELVKALDLDPALDYAGPDRSLGLLYLDAPGWPLSIGSRSKATQHLEAAVELRPQFPENRICLAEAWAKWNDSRKLHAELQKIHQMLPAAEKQFPPSIWAGSWNDWRSRLQALKATDRQLPARSHPSPSERGARPR